MQGTLFLIPTYLSPDNDADILAPIVKDVIAHTKIFWVENPRTSRRFISSLKLSIAIEKLRFNVLDENPRHSALQNIFESIMAGEDVGIISEAGLPAIADPGGVVVSDAHRKNIRVIPLPGPSAITQALMGAGFNGQHFSFHGYLPIARDKRRRAIRQLERDLSKTGYTQVFMETPYRNISLFGDLTEVLSPETFLSIAADISGKSETILTKQVRLWRSEKPRIHKIPAVFSIGNAMSFGF